MRFRNTRHSILAYPLAAIVLTVICAGTGAWAQTSAAEPSDAVLALGATEQYRLGTGDKLRVIVFGEDDLGGEYEVDSGGYVRLPLIGQVMAANLPVQKFEDDVKTKLEDGYLLDARVSVEVMTYRPFYIMGEVNTPGEYPYVNGMSILNAIALAGGYTYRANSSRVYIRRNGLSGEISTPADQTAKISPGDIIRVGERFF